MLFNSYIFIFLFLPAAVSGYFLLNRINSRIAEFFLLLMSFWFYGYFNPFYLFLMVSSIAVNFFLSRGIINLKKRKKTAKPLLWAGVIFNIGLIGYFKYYDFFVTQINTVFKTDIMLKNILLPLGISFFTFQQLSFVIDTYRTDATEVYSFLDYAVFISFFPQLVAGPIVLHDEFIPQLRDTSKKTADPQNLVSGICLFGLGLFKKVLIADRLGTAVDWGFSNSETVSSLELIFIAAAYTFQIYFDFSGYSDMAVGIGKMFNFTLPKNFDSPYKAGSVTDFWKRWHMTLTRFLRTYVYFPLGGSRKGKLRTYLNIMIVFLVSGIWHGANWTFILWGLLHGMVQCLERLFDGFIKKIPKVIKWCYTFTFVMAAFLLFRSDSVTQWMDFMKRILSFSDMSVNDKFIQAFFLPETWVIYDKMNLWAFNAHIPNFPILLILMICLGLCLLFKNNYDRNFKAEKKTLVFMTAVYAVSLISLGGVSTFLYFNF